MGKRAIQLAPYNDVTLLASTFDQLKFICKKDIVTRFSMVQVVVSLSSLKNQPEVATI